jgi:catechol 2,3-dioxygenase-like lactoylglutathione lyase family enzyme
MDFKLELVAIPVTDVDRAKAFYVDGLGFNPDFDHQVNDELRFVQLTPERSRTSPGAASCSWLTRTATAGPSSRFRRGRRRSGPSAGEGAACGRWPADERLNTSRHFRDRDR